MSERIKRRTFGAHGPRQGNQNAKAVIRTPEQYLEDLQALETFIRRYFYPSFEDANKPYHWQGDERACKAWLTWEHDAQMFEYLSIRIKFLEVAETDVRDVLNGNVRKWRRQVRSEYRRKLYVQFCADMYDWPRVPLDDDERRLRDFHPHNLWWHEVVRRRAEILLRQTLEAIDMERGYCEWNGQ